MGGSSSGSSAALHEAELGVCARVREGHRESRPSSSHSRATHPPDPLRHPGTHPQEAMLPSKRSVGEKSVAEGPDAHDSAATPSSSTGRAPCRHSQRSPVQQNKAGGPTTDFIIREHYSAVGQNQKTLATDCATWRTSKEPGPRTNTSRTLQAHCTPRRVAPPPGLVRRHAQQSQSTEKGKPQI